MSARSLRSLAPYVGLLLISAGLIAASVQWQAGKVCKGVKVSILPEDQAHLLTEEEVLHLLDANLLQGMPINRLDLAGLEAELEQHPYVQQADLFVTDGEHLKAKLVARTPVARVSGTHSPGYYLDSAGYALPLVFGRSLRCPVVTGAVPEVSPGVRTPLREENIQNLIPLLNTLAELPFWRAQVAQLHLLENGQVEMQLQAGDFLIELGAPVQLKTKLNVLETFMRQVLARTGWNAYSRIRLGYDNQVIAVRTDQSTV